MNKKMIKLRCPFCKKEYKVYSNISKETLCPECQAIYNCTSITDMNKNVYKQY